MGFFRSSESKPRSKSRFSFRRHSEDIADVDASALKPQPPLPLHHSRKAHPAPPVAARPPPHPPASFSSTFVSSASSSVTSPSALQRASTLGSKRASDSLVSTDSDDSELPRTPSEASLLVTTPRDSLVDDAAPSPLAISTPATHAGTMQTTTHAAPNGRNQRHSLVSYHNLHHSMSYKNRQAHASDPLTGSSSGSTSSLRATTISRRSETSSRRSETSSRRSDTGSRRSETSSRTSSFGNGEFVQHGLEHIDELSASTASEETASPSADTDGSSSLRGSEASEVRMTEANVAALQTRRAFQQMVLAIEDDDSDDDSDSDGYMRRESSDSISAYNGSVVQLGADEYRKFQFRLRQLEDLCHEQALKQTHMEDTIEREVQTRTQKVIEAMEKKIAMYKQAKDLEVEREIQRRVSEQSRMSSSRESSFLGLSTGSLLPPQYPTLSNSDPALKGKPLDKILHPRRTRKRMEMLREREEQQKREMEQFREFIRTTETRATVGFGRMSSRDDHGPISDTTRASVKALKDPHITEDLFTATHNELIEMICVLRKHVSVQEGQLDEAKRLISAAIEAREEAEETAREAVELTMELDSRLERASQEMIVIKDELRRSSEFSMRMSYIGGHNGSIDRSSSKSSSFYGTTPSGNSSPLTRTGSFPR